MAKLGREFEEAVHSFVKTLDADAEVLFDHTVPDVHTGEPRQCDVWINARALGHFPISIYVSCKDKKQSNRKLGTPDIETFKAETTSRGASMGVIYTNVGFARPALEKARLLGIACCRLYRNEPADIPGLIWFESFACSTNIRLTIHPDCEASRPMTWNELFDISVEDENSRGTILDMIAADFAKNEGDSLERWASQKREGIASFPFDWESHLLCDIAEIECRFWLHITVHWKRYRGRLEGSMLNGSYCLADHSFLGNQTTPAIDMKSGHPGDGWTEITDSNFTPLPPMVLIVLHSPDIRTTLREGMGVQPCFIRYPASS